MIDVEDINSSSFNLGLWHIKQKAYLARAPWIREKKLAFD